MTKITEQKAKAKFLTSLKVERTPDGQWRLTAPLFYFSEVADMLIHVPTGFVSDFDSVPRLPIIYWMFKGASDEAAVIHDWLYTSHAVPRKIADDVFDEAMKVKGVWAWRRIPVWLGVRIGGGSRWANA
jgi:hypothetical protein